MIIFIIIIILPVIAIAIGPGPGKCVLSVGFHIFLVFPSLIPHDGYLLSGCVNIRLDVQVRAGRGEVHGLGNLILVPGILLLGDHIHQFNQIDFLVMDDFVTLIVIIKFLDSL